MADQGIPATAESSAYFGEQWVAEHSSELPDDVVTYIEDMRSRIKGLEELLGYNEELRGRLESTLRESLQKGEVLLMTDAGLRVREGNKDG